MNDERLQDVQLPVHWVIEETQPAARRQLKGHDKKDTKGKRILMKRSPTTPPETRPKKTRAKKRRHKR